MDADDSHQTASADKGALNGQSHNQSEEFVCVSNNRMDAVDPLLIYQSVDANRTSKQFLEQAFFKASSHNSTKFPSQGLVDRESQPAQIFCSVFVYFDDKQLL